MIYKSAIHRDLNTNSFTVFIILLSITLSVVSVRVLKHAAIGDINNSQVIIFLTLAVIALLPFILQLTTIICVLQTFQRLYADSEMVIWESAKMPLYRWITAIMPLVLFMAFLVGVLVFALRPWSFDVQKKLERQFQTQQQWFNATTGVFHKLGDNSGTLYVEQDSLEEGHLRNLFLFRNIKTTSPDKQGFNLIISREGKVGGSQDSAVNFIDGVFYDVQSKKTKKILFSSLGVSSVTPYERGGRRHRAMSTPELFKSNTAGSKAELFWRFSIVIQTVIMSLFSLGFAFSPPRKRNLMSILVIIIIALVYFNLISLSTKFIARGQGSSTLIFFGLHSLFSFLALTLIVIRTYRFNLLTFIRYKLANK